MISKIKTVKIQHPDNPKRAMLINEGDFDPDKHVLWGKKPARKKKAKKKD